MKISPSLRMAALRQAGVADSGQEKSKPKPEVVADRVELSGDFPKNWVGNWAGELHINGGPNDGQRLPMSLNIAPKGADVYRWEIKYGDQPTRPYELVRQGDHWAVDEKNSIVIDSYLSGDVFISQFEVAQTRVTARYQLKAGENGDPQLQLEMQNFTRAPVSRSGGGRFVVDSFALQSLHQATLKREA